MSYCLTWRDPVPIIRCDLSGIVHQATTALARARAAQIHIVRRKANTNEATIADSIAAAVRGSIPSGGFKPATLISFDCRLVRTLAGTTIFAKWRFR